MKTVGNILWLILVGWHTAIVWLVLGVLLCLPIITIPFAVQCFKFAGFSLWPFGREAVKSTSTPAATLLGNILWILPGLVLAIGYFLGGVLLCITIIGIPFGIQSFKFAGLALAPFGRVIVSRTEADSLSQPTAQAA